VRSSRDNLIKIYSDEKSIISNRIERIRFAFCLRVIIVIREMLTHIFVFEPTLSYKSDSAYNVNELFIMYSVDSTAA